MRWPRVLVYTLSGAAVLGAVAVLWVDGHLPAPVPRDGADWSLAPLSEALRAVDSRGQVDLVELKRRHAALGAFVASLAGTSPATRPELFPTEDDRTAYWLNAFHAMVLAELLETRSQRASPTAAWLRTVPVGGERLTRAAIFRRYLAPAGDARLYLALFTGARGSGVLDGAPFDGQVLGAQLDDALRRFVRRKENAWLEGTTVRLSDLFRRHRDALLAALPDERKQVLQIAWAYLPDACEGGEPCLTRSDLDRACGHRLEACTLEYAPFDDTLATRN